MTPGRRKLRVGLVNDSPLAVEALRRTMENGGHTVAWVARNGVEAVEKCREQLPHVVLMDLHMPVMGGAEATRRIMAATPLPILIVTADTEAALEPAYEAMAAGALDLVATPTLRASGVSGGNHLLDKLASVGRLARATLAPVTPGAPVSRSTPPAFVDAAPTQAPLVILGASTGGPAALVDVLGGLPRGLAGGVVIVQHVDQHFAPGMARWLHERSGFPVELAEDGGHPEPGVAHVAATNDHLVLDTTGAYRYSEEPRSMPYRPSVDVFMRSVASCGKFTGAAGLLTGMGRDGAEGLLALKRAGWLTVAQDEASCVVYGMPKAAVELGAVIRVATLGEIAGVVAARLQSIARRA
jgi:chemotaxis response regulator CheB